MENLDYIAKGGCFLAGTLIGTPEKDTAIESLKKGDKVISFNESTGEQETSTVGSLDTLQRDHYYIINGIISTTGEHPFYTTRGIKEVKDLNVGDKLVGRYDKEVKIETIQVVHKNVTVYNLLNVDPNHNYYAGIFLVHNKGSIGGGRSSSKSFSSSKSSKTKSSITKSKTSSKKSTKKAGSTVKTKTGKTVKSSNVTPKNKTYSQQKGIVGDSGYSPRFTNGYSAPAGSVVYYRDTSFVDYLPWIYLFGQSNAAPQNQQATVVQPDNKEVQVKPVQEGVDGLAVLNWVIIVILVASIIAGAVYLVNKVTSK